MLGYLIIDLEITKNYGIPVGMLVGGVVRLFEIHNADISSECYYSMKEMAKAIGMSYRQVRDAAKKAKEAGLIDYRYSYKPGTTVKTTYWSLP